MIDSGKVKIIVLAAGKGKRMESDLPKVLLPLKGQPMLQYVHSSIKKVTDEKPVTVVGHKEEMVRSEFGDSLIYASQGELLGTGHAVMCAKGHCEEAENIVVLSGDQPFITSGTIEKLVGKHLESGATITFAETEVEDFSDWRKAFIGFGRVLRKDGKITGIREYKDATEEEKAIREVNAGTYCFKAAWLWENLEKIKNDNAQGEYYLTELFHIAKDEGEKIEAIKIDPREALGANTKEELEILENFQV